MVMTEKKGLQIDEDIRHHERAWIMKKIMWFIIVIFILTVILGYVGGGETSVRTISSKHISVKYHRFTHSSSPTLLSVILNAPLKDTVMVSFSNDYMSKVNIENIIPEPVSSSNADGIVTYFFLYDKTFGKGRMKIDFLMKADKFGSQNFSIATDNDRVNLQQFIYP
jgi:hypothetical protein